MEGRKFLQDNLSLQIAKYIKTTSEIIIHVSEIFLNIFYKINLIKSNKKETF